MVALVTLFTGCTPSTVAVSTTVKDALVTRFIPVSKIPKVYTDKTVGSDGVFPPEIVMGKVNYGDELSTWTGSIPDLGISNGEPLALYIFNRTGEEVTYSIGYQIPEKLLKDDNGNEYQPSMAAVFWVELSDKIIKVPSETVAAVSIRVLVPEKTKDFSLPDRWAFQLYISPVQEGNIQRAYLQNWLIGMK
jgi:hypothetical protein